MAPKFVPPFSVGQRVKLLVEYSNLPVGSLGTITWVHPWPDLPYRVKWDESPKPGPVVFGMDDIGWLMTVDEIGVAD